MHVTNTGPKKEQCYNGLDEALEHMKNLMDSDPSMASAVELIAIGQRLERDGEFDTTAAAEIADIVMRNRDPNAALEFLERVGRYGPKTMLHRAVIGEITRRARIGCG